MIIEYDAQCGSCDGTGIYVGICERDGAGVVCHICKGSGQRHVHIEYEPAGTRKLRPGIERVFQINTGIVIRAGSENNLSDFGGMPYVDWLRGHPFPILSENRQFTCPAWWYQSADSQKMPNWKECIGIGAFSQCEHFPGKAACWERWDKEFGKK